MTQFIDPKTLSRVKDLPLVAKTLAQGFLHGRHHSRQRGVGIEFSQYRVYEPGDALAKVDWKLFARSDRYFVREAERESEIDVWLVLDTSNSMSQRSQSGKQKTQQQEQWHKLDYARYLLATMAYLAQKQGDAVGFFGLSTQQNNFLSAYRGERHLHKIMLELARVKPGGLFPQLSTVQHQLSQLRKSGLIFVVSDFYQQHNEIVAFISQLAGPKTEVVAVHCECEDERSFPYQGQICFEDLENQQQRQVWAQDIKTDYLQQRQLCHQALRAQLSKFNISYLYANIDQPLDQTLTDFLRLRQQAL